MSSLGKEFPRDMKKRRVEEDAVVANRAEETSTLQVFEYLGDGHLVPDDAVGVRFHPTVKEVKRCTFMGCSEINEVVFTQTQTAINKTKNTLQILFEKRFDTKMATSHSDTRKE